MFFKAQVICLFAPTVREELAFGPLNMKHPKDKIEQEVKTALKIVNLSDKEQDPPLALSFGQQKRVSIAAILAMRSRILVMDEPTAGQDYQNYMNFMDSILQMPGFEAILFITHDVDLAVIYANRVLLIADGRLVADGKPQDVLRDFKSARSLPPCAFVASSLNLKRLPQTGRFMRAEALAHILIPKRRMKMDKKLTNVLISLVVVLAIFGIIMFAFGASKNNIGPFNFQVDQPTLSASLRVCCPWSFDCVCGLSLHQRQQGLGSGHA